MGSSHQERQAFQLFLLRGLATINPLSVINTLPIAEQRNGDFSQALNTQGAQRTIYDPWTTQVNGNTVTRLPFAGNIIPATRIDPTAKKMMGDLWQPNRPGCRPDAGQQLHHRIRQPFQVLEHLRSRRLQRSRQARIFGRYNQFRTFTVADDWTGGSAAFPLGRFAAACAELLRRRGLHAQRQHHTQRPRRLQLDQRFLRRPQPRAQARGSGEVLARQRLVYVLPGDLPQIYYPGVQVTQGSGANALGKAGYWYQTPNSYNIDSKISKSIGKHYVKAGGEYRRDNTNAARPQYMRFDFSPSSTANTFNSPNTALSGDGWASFLLGAMDSSSYAASIPIQRPRNNFFALFRTRRLQGHPAADSESWPAL